MINRGMKRDSIFSYKPETWGDKCGKWMKMVDFPHNRWGLPSHPTWQLRILNFHPCIDGPVHFCILHSCTIFDCRRVQYARHGLPELCIIKRIPTSLLSTAVENDNWLHCTSRWPLFWSSHQNWGPQKLSCFWNWLPVNILEKTPPREYLHQIADDIGNLFSCQRVRAFPQKSRDRWCFLVRERERARASDGVSAAFVSQLTHRRMKDTISGWIYFGF